MKNLTTSDIQRQNILNNRYAIEKINEYIDFQGLFFENEYKFTKKMIAEFYEIDERTVERYLEKYSTELKHNGYIIVRGKRIKEFKSLFASDIYVASKTTILGLFNFRAFLNLGMLLVESERARQLRSKILDIVIETINKKTGGGTKYINKRDTDYLPIAIRESKYRKEFSSALKNCVNMGNFKYGVYTDKIYQAIFKENAKEYKQILKLAKNENARDTMYAEILNLIASFETGLAYELNTIMKKKGRKLAPHEVDELFKNFAEHPLQHPHIEDARTKMASRDLHFREATHQKLEEYIQSISPADFDRFLGEQSINFAKQLEEAKDVFKRLKDSQ